MSKRVQLVIGVVLLLIVAFNTYNDLATARYIRDTKPRDAAQEQCQIGLSDWLQNWLTWRWDENPDATVAQVKEYRRVHPQPRCDFSR